jgi:thioredoxin reductase (NADPH)
MTSFEYDLVIIGGGPAGLTAGLYAARARLKTRLVEKLSPGGQVLTTDWVENYPGFPEGVSGFELMDKMRQQAERFDLEITSSEATAVERQGELFRLRHDGEELLSRTIVIATGALPNTLGVPGEAELTGKGVSYCATCDGPFYKESEVAVIGGGDTAAEEALFLTRFASQVHLCHRRDELRATGVLRERLKAEPKVRIHWSTTVTAIEKGESGQVSGAVLKDLKTGRTSRLPVQGVFLFVGTKPVTEFLKGFVELDSQGFVKTDPELATSQAGVWAAGDVRSKTLRQISTAVGDGAVAAYQAERYIENKFHVPRK